MKVLFFIIILSTSMYAMFEDFEAGPKGLGLGDAYYTLANDPTAIFYNPAGLDQQKGFSAQAGFGNKFGHKDLNEMYLAGNYQINKLGSLGFGITQFGPSFYQERQLIIGHGIEIAPYLKLGYSIEGYQVTQDTGTGKESDMAIGVNLGLLSRIYDRWQIGFAIHNLTQPEIGTEGEQIPQSLAAGVSYFFNEGISTNLNLRVENDRPISILAGQEYTINDYFALRAGLGTEPRHISGGMSIKYRYVDIIYGCKYVENLPLNHQVSVNFTLPDL
jgi:hypothetical protein